MSSSPEVFKVDPRPDGGQFADGNGAALAWDVLSRAGRHTIPDVLDLSGCVHLKPYALACLCGLGELARHNGRTISVIQPSDDRCADHLARLGVPEFFDCEWATLDQRESNLRARRVGWPPRGAATEIVELLAPRAQLPPGTFPRMVESLDEIIRNALTHAASPIDCIVAGQAFDGTDKVEVAVLDFGQTICRHLTRNPEYSDIRTDRDAILKATEDGVTGTPRGQRNARGEDNSGAGLAELRSYAEIGGGELTILSGVSWITCRAAHTPVEGALYGGFRGCLVNMRYFTGNELPAGPVETIL